MSDDTSTSIPTARPARRSRPLTVASIAAGAVFLLVFAYCLVCVGLLTSSQKASEENNQNRAIERAEWFGRISIFERHKPHFNIGTAQALKGELDAAQGPLERALELTPESDECAVRQNLSYVYEQQADEHRQAGRTSEANAKFDDARTTLQDAPEACRPPDSEQDQTMDQAEERIDESQDSMNNPPDASGSGDGGEGESGGEGEGDGGDSGDGGGQGGEGDDGGDSGDGGGQSGDDGEDGGEETEGTGGGEGDDQGPGTGQSSQEQKREELRERSADSQRRQEEENSRNRSSGSTHGKPW